MKLVVGLGNPGIQYSKNRHNIGFTILDEYLSKKGISSFREKFNALIVKDGDIIYAKPLTYMNLSGDAISQIVSFYKLDPKKDLLVIYDEMDLKVGEIKLKSTSNSSSHNGIKSIISHMGKEFLRLKIGIDRPKEKSITSHVLGNFMEDEIKNIYENIDKIFKIIDDFVNNKDINLIISKYNQKVKNNKETNFRIRLSKKNDIKELLTLKDMALEYQKENNLKQWSKNYPLEEDFIEDIEKKQGYIYEKNGKIYAYASLCFGIEKNYFNIISGNIDNEIKYSTLHRVMVNKNYMNQNIANDFLKKLIKISYNNSYFIIRIDTHKDNKAMMRVIEKLNFNYIANVYIEDRTERLVFELLIGG